MVNGKSELKVAIVAGAFNALDYKKKNPSASDDEVLGHVTRNAGEILKKMDEEEI